jgi:RsmE family RNA methyltransferase
MNLILFEPRELGKPVPRRDERTIHLLKVLHKKTGDSFDAGILGGQRGTGRIEKINIDGSILYSLRLTEDAPPRLPLRVAVGFPRPIQLRRLLRDLSNLGVASIDLMGTELGEKSYRNTNLLNDGGARAALVEGAIQARDTIIPALSLYPGLEDWLRERPWDKAASRQSPVLVAADNVRPEGAMARLGSIPGSMVLAIGCERGWSDKERDDLEHSGFLRLSLGERALRTETACVAAVALALEKIGCLG